MFQSQRQSGNSSFRKFGFSEKVWRCLDRAGGSSIKLCSGDRAQIMHLLANARETMDIASDDVVSSLLNRNPHIISVAHCDGNELVPSGLLAILPLNEEGFSALISRKFDGKNPNPNWICCPNEAPVGLYVWLVFMPATFGRLLGAIADVIDPMAPEPCPMFSRSTNDHSTRLHRGAGFKPACEYYPDCDPALLVTFPEAEIQPKRTQKTEIRLARTIDDIFKVFSVRSATYIAEQFCLYDEEFDGNDFCSTHFLGLIDGDAVGCVRLRFFSGFAKLERLAVRAEYRQSRMSYQLVRAALAHCKKKGYRFVLGHSRLDLVRFWKVFGFKPIADRNTFTFANVQYVEILLEQEADEAPIQMSVNPMIVIRPEGAWDRPGPFDLSLSASDPQRARLLEERTRTVNRQKIAA